MSTGPSRLGKYELQERLGRGGMGEVWKAFDTQLRRHVAIKLLHADLQNDTSFTARFQREAQVIASLHHPNIVQLYDFQVSQPAEAENAICYMVMDYVEGQTLAQYLRSTSRVGKYPPATEIVHLFAPISLAIDYAHQRGMIHRDIKPSNILLDKRNTARTPVGEPILTDFGIVKLLGAPAVTVIGSMLGTPHYVSPEQARGDAGSERSDIYSLGVILYEMCTGLLPFQGENAAAVLMQHLHATPTLPNDINPSLPPALTIVIMCSLAKDPTARFPTASALAVALAEALNRPVPEGLRSRAVSLTVSSEPNSQGPVQPSLPLEMPSASSFPTRLTSSSAPFAAPSRSGSGSIGAGSLPDGAPLMSSAQNPLPVSSPFTPLPGAFNPVMAQEYVRGESLEERLSRLNQPLEERDVLIYASQVLDRLEDMAQHTPPLVHGNIKPATLLIGNKDQRAHLVDGFGATQWGQTAAATPGYAPLEQLQGRAEPRSDLYALAATMHHLLTNRNPRNSPPFVYPLARALNPRVSLEVEHLLIRALTNDISGRYQSATEMKRDIDDILLRYYGIAGSTGGDASGMSGSMEARGGRAGKSAIRPSSLVRVTGRIQSWLSRVDEASSQPMDRSQQAGVQPQLSPMSAAFTPPLSSSTSQPMGLQTVPFLPQPVRQRKARRWRAMALVAVLLLLILAGVLSSSLLLRRGNPHPTTTTTSGLGVGVTRAPDGEYIGVSDGTFAFDTNRLDGALKRQAADKLKTGDSGSALSLWQQAVGQDTNDAEALIYAEDQRVLASGRPYITLVVGTMIGSGLPGSGDLQGAYVAQKEYNDGFKLPGGTMVRLLVANSGSERVYAKSVAQQIVQAAKADKTIVGVMGWPYSSRVTNAVGILATAHIPMVAQTASSSLLTGISPYFFRVVPPDTAQALAGAKYLEQQLHARAVALFFDPSEPYSTSLANAFRQQFTADGNTIVATEQYTEGKPQTLPGQLQDALSHNPDVIYFSGFSTDVSVLVTNLPTSGKFANLLVMGGDGLYQLQGYSTSAHASFSRLRFTAFAYPDEWGIQGLAGQEPQFFREYPEYFDPNKAHQGSPYGYTRPDSEVMLAYDATMALLEGGRMALTGATTPLTPDALRQALAGITDSHAIQGVGGQIAFGADGNPIDKAVVVLSVDTVGHIQIVSVQGHFLKGA